MELMQIPINFEGDLDILMSRLQTLDDTLGLNTQGFSKLSSISLELANQALYKRTKGEITFEVDVIGDFLLSIEIILAIKEEELGGSPMIVGYKNDYFNFLRSFNSSVHLDNTNGETVISCKIQDVLIKETLDQTSFEELARVLKYSDEDSLINRTKVDLINDLKERSKNIREKNLEIEELYKYQAQQRELIAKIQEADKMKTQFLANMSHELRTPLNSIIGFSELLEDGLVGDLTDEQLDILKDILNSARHLLDLINRILDISKIEAGMMELNYSIVDVNRLIDDVSSQLNPLLSEKSIELIRKLPQNLLINVDELRIKQILINLLSNAIKFSNNNSKIKFGAQMQEDNVIIAVEDEGIGMKQTDLDKIFQEFTQVDESHTRAYQGTGLGLSLVKKLVELHQGTIWVESIYGEGTTFFFTIPIH